MRVQLIAKRRARAERGAIALLAAFLATTLCIVAAFTVDFGIAYVSKQQLQEGADAGALAAAQVYKGQTGVPCDTLAADSTLEAQAQAAADAWAEQNRPGKRGGEIEVTCSDTSTLTVTYTTEGDTDVGLGQLAGVGDEITTGRIAAATIGKAKAGGLRPWGICSGVAVTSGDVIFVPMEGGSTTTEDAEDLCGDDGPPGGWWVAQCTGQGNGLPLTIEAVRDGCDTSTYQPVPSQPTDPATLLTYLQTQCPARRENATCLSSDTGNSFHKTNTAWQTLVGTSFMMPVICSSPTCTTVEYTSQGSNATYAIQRLATVTLCGFELMPFAASSNWPTTGPCATNNPKNYTSTDVTHGGGLFLVITSLTGGPGTDWILPEYSNLRLTK